ncbi:MAG: helix-turn-helix domain-containing protein [Candidatus Omnitrophota bacterium]|nr:MAG: helix-turn-helix domain-containing protein [Candidatus Omnitrophota bacterium]
MGKEKLITTREVSLMLGLPEKDVIDLAAANLLPHFKVGGEFLRFKREDVLKVRKRIKKKYNLPNGKHRGLGRLKEFIYFNDFYIVCTIIIMVLLWIIFKDFPLSN